MQNVTMSSQEAISAKLAECYVTINGNRYNFMQMIDFEGKLEKNKTDVPILGRIMKGHKPTGMSGTFSGTAHFNQSIMRQALLDYKNTGKDIFFEIQVSNEDPASSAGRQTITFTGCNLDGGMLAKFDASSENLTESIEGTFEDFKMPKSFDLLDGMQ